MAASAASSGGQSWPINKIHPTRHTIHDPYRDYHMLARVCEKIEADYRLERDNHQAKTVGAENRAVDMEANAGVESLLGWIRRECGEQIRGAKTWGELHDVMRDHGLELRERANGLVFADTSGVTVKASAVDRGFSQPKLEACLGQFQARAEGGERRPPSKAYEKKPLRCGVDTIDLYARYKSEQAENSHARAVADSKARERKSRLIETAKLHGRLRRDTTSAVPHHSAAGGSGKGFRADLGHVTGAGAAPYAAMQASADPRRAALAAAKYVHEREQRRAVTFDLPKHTVYASIDRAAAAYGGIRIVDGQTLALLLQNGEVKVMPVNETSAQRLKNLKVGTAIDITPDGIVKTIGRSR